MLKKIFYILSSKQKKQVPFLLILFLFGIIFEMIGLGALLPSFAVISSPNIENKFPYLSQYIKKIGNPTHNELIVIGLSFLVFIYVVKAIYLLYMNWKQSFFSTELMGDISNSLFSGYIMQPYSFHLKRNSSELLRNIQVEVNQFTILVQSVISLSVEISALIGIVFMLILIEPLGVFSSLCVLLFVSLIFTFITKKKILNWGQQRMELDKQISQFLLEGIGGIKEINLMGKHSFFLERFFISVKKKSYLSALQTATQNMPKHYLEVIGVLGLCSVIFAMIIQNKATDEFLPALTIFAVAAFRIIPSINRIISYLQQIRFRRGVVDLLYNEFIYLRRDNLINTENVLIEFNNLIEFANVKFRYDDTSHNIIENMSLVIKKGQFIGITGLSGSGKSTMIDILLGLLKPSQGEVLVDGANINRNIRAWQNHVGYVPQSIYLTDDTLRKNIAFGLCENEISDHKLNIAIKYSQLDAFITDLPDGLNTFVGERGIRLSGGQRQRIAIARALYNDPSILVLDEATSALDNETENEVMSAITNLMGIKTIIVVAHRLSTITKCDVVYVVTNGRLLKSELPLLNTEIK